jgi:tryptophan synthase beta chain
VSGPVERIDLPASELPTRWYNVIPDLPSPPEQYYDPGTGEPAQDDYMEGMMSRALLAQEFSFDSWIPIPPEVLDAYRLWRPTPLYRARALERELDTPAEIYFKFEGGSPTGSHKLNSALAQAYLARQEGIRCLVTDTGAGQWGSALALAGALMGVEVVVYMVRSSYHQKPYRRHLMELYGATVLPSPGEDTEFGRRLLAEDPNHPGSEGTAVSEAIERVRDDADARFSMGAFANHVLLHQTVFGLEAREQLESVGRRPDWLIASVGCGSNLGGLALPWVRDKLDGAEIEILAAEPSACATLTDGEWRLDSGDASGIGPMVRTFTLGCDFVPPPIHAGGLRYHGAAPLIGLLRHEGLIEARSYEQQTVFEAGRMFARLHGLLPAPETAHAIRAVIDVANRCTARGEKKTILFSYSGHGLLDLGAYGHLLSGKLDVSADEMPSPTAVAAN